MGVGAEKLPPLDWLFPPPQDWAKPNGLKSKCGQPGLLFHGLCLTCSSDAIGDTSGLIFSTKCLETLKKEPPRTPRSMHWSVPIFMCLYCCPLLQETSIPALVPTERPQPAQFHLQTLASTFLALEPQPLACTGDTGPAACTLPCLPRVMRQTAPCGLW